MCCWEQRPGCAAALEVESQARRGITSGEGSLICSGVWPASAAAKAAPHRKIWPEQSSADEYPAFMRQSSRARSAYAHKSGVPNEETKSGVNVDIAGCTSWSGADENASPLSANVGLAHLDVAEQGLIGDSRDASLHKGERGSEHPAIVVVGELRKDIRENLRGDSVAWAAGLRSVTTLCRSDKSLDDGVIEGVIEAVERPSMLGMDGAEAGEIPREGLGLNLRGLDCNPELNSSPVSREDTAVCSSKECDPIKSLLRFLSVCHGGVWLRRRVAWCGREVSDITGHRGSVIVAVRAQATGPKLYPVFVPLISRPSPSRNRFCKSVGTEFISKKSHFQTRPQNHSLKFAGMELISKKINLKTVPAGRERN
ncbi:hypothetical protein K438DRAFT_1786986 [Mycena galopus ATCC 62051]|nr:hypothetical protein K438DRAFT_1786986 [Mycena galopus ATCC 62051]